MTKRLEEYEEKTLPLTDFYEKEGILRKVDGDGSIEETTEKINAILDVFR